MSAWLQVKAVLSEAPADWAMWAEVFSRHGLEGTVQTDNPPSISAYVPPGEEARVPALRQELEQFGVLAIEESAVEEENWAESWKQFFKPRRIGKRWVIRPTWEEFEAGPKDRVIVLDPGQAFGTGDHPTTRGCLELMEEVDFAGAQVADIGCGSGVLSVAAMMLGAAHVDAVDVENLSVHSTRENAVRNEVEVSVLEGRGFAPLGEGLYDVVLSNIISAALIQIAPDAAGRVKPGGAWIVSGIIIANWPDVQKAAASYGFRLDREIQEDDWIAARLLR
jgi:ribosomal protein L11 methyltransferase